MAGKLIYGDPRFDNLEFVPVPLPAALPLLLVAFGRLAAVRRRSRT